MQPRSAMLMVSESNLALCIASSFACGGAKVEDTSSTSCLSSMTRTLFQK